jgi:hypothetical protein
MQAKSLTNEKHYGRLTAKIGACLNRDIVVAVIRYKIFWLWWRKIDKLWGDVIGQFSQKGIMS